MRPGCHRWAARAFRGAGSPLLQKNDPRARARNPSTLSDAQRKGSHAQHTGRDRRTVENGIDREGEPTHGGENGGRNWFLAMEPVQKGNPHGLTLRQHIFPASAIRRFCGTDGRMEVVWKRTGQSIRVPPSADLFCAKRVWSHGAEHGFMVRIEDDYRAVAEKYTICTGDLLGPEADAVSEMYALWNARFRFRTKPHAPLTLVGVPRSNAPFDQDHEERREKADVVTCRPDGTVAARHIWGMQILQHVDAFMLNRPRVKWAAVKAVGEPLVVPDHFSAFPLYPAFSGLCLRGARSPRYGVRRAQPLRTIAGNRVLVPQVIGFRPDNG